MTVVSSSSYAITKDEAQGKARRARQNPKHGSPSCEHGVDPSMFSDTQDDDGFDNATLLSKYDEKN